jgi:hypothetical protein
MATIVERIIDPDNGAGTHYTKAKNWETAWGDVPGNGALITNDSIAKAVCRCTGGTKDDGTLVVWGWAEADATRFPWIQADRNYWHGGIPRTSGNYYRLNGGYPYTVQLRQPYTFFDGIMVAHNGTSEGALILENPADQVMVANCIVWPNSDITGDDVGIMPRNIQAGTVQYVVNCLVGEFDGTGTIDGSGFRNFTGSNAADIYVHNCTFIRNRLGIHRTSATPELHVSNCLMFDNLTQNYSGGPNTGGNNTWQPAIDPVSPYCTIDATGWTEAQVFRDPTNLDFRLRAGSPALAVGADLSSHPNLPVSTDFAGTAREGIFDIGWHQITTGSISDPLIARRAAMAGFARKIGGRPDVIFREVAP